MFNHDERLILGRKEVGQFGAKRRELMRSIATRAEYLDLSTKQRLNRAGIILAHANFHIPDQGNSHTVRNSLIAGDNTHLRVLAGQETDENGAVEDSKAGFYNSQANFFLANPDALGGKDAATIFGEHHSILVYARPRADGVTGEGSTQSWLLEGWVGFYPEEVIDYKANPNASIEDNYGEPYAALVYPGFEETMPIHDPRARELVSYVDKIALACLEDRLIVARSVGSHIAPAAVVFEPRSLQTAELPLN